MCSLTRGAIREAQRIGTNTDLLKGISQRPRGRTLRNKCTHTIPRFVEWLGGLEHAFSALEKIPLQSDLVDMPTECFRGGSMNKKESRKKKVESGSASVKFTNPEVTSFWEPTLTDRSKVDQVTGKTGYTHDAFTSVTWGNSSDTIIWSDEMEDQHRKFKRQPKKREGLGKSFNANPPEKRRAGRKRGSSECTR